MLLCLNIILNSLTYILSYFFFANIYPKRNYHCIFKIILFVVFIVAQAMISSLEIPICNLISSIAVIILINITMFKVNKLHFLLYDIILYFCSFLSDILSVLCISVAHNRVIENTLHNEKMVLSSYLLTDIFILILYGVMIAILKRNQHKDMLRYEMLVYIFLLALEILSTIYISNEILSQSSGTFLIVFLSACFFLDLYIIFMFSKLSKSRETELKYALLQQQSQMQMAVYHELSEKYALSTKVVHDAKRQFCTLKELINDQEIQTYYDNVIKEFDSLYPQFQYENKVLKVIINHAIFRAEHNHIQFDMDIEDCDIAFIEDIDLTTIFTNLLDNAFDACNALKQEKKWIHFHLENKMGFIIIHISNPYTEIVKKSHNLFFTTKKNHLGIGLSNVQNAVKKYNGIFEIDTDNDLFDVSITIPQQ